MQKYIKKNIFLKNKIFSKKIEIYIIICSKNVDVLYVYVKYIFIIYIF